MPSKLDSAKVWSLLDPKPCLYYVPSHDTHIVLWNGFATTQKIAAIVASEVLLGIFSTPKMKADTFNEFKTAYYSGVFGGEDWNINTFVAGSYYHYISRKLVEHIRSKISDEMIKNPMQVLQWFDKRNIVGVIE